MAYHSDSPASSAPTSPPITAVICDDINGLTQRIIHQTHRLERALDALRGVVPTEIVKHPNPLSNTSGPQSLEQAHRCSRDAFDELAAQIDRLY
jgi:hypothetical protein